MAFSVPILLISLVDLIRISILVGIPVFILAWIGRLIFSKFHPKQSWLLSAIISTYIIVFVLLILAYFFPSFLSLADYSKGTIPETIAPTALDYFLTYLANVLRVAILSALFCVLLLPLEFAGAALQDSLQKNVSNKTLRFGLAIFGSVFIATILILFVLPGIGISVIPGIIYMVYFAFN